MYGDHMHNDEGQSDSEETRFNKEHVYLQWLIARKAMPYGFNRYLVYGMWILCLGFIVFDYPKYTVLIFDVNFLILAAIPFALISLDFLYFTPRIIHDDSGTRTLDVLFSCPVRTGDIFTDLRKYIARLNLLKIIPFLLLFAFRFYESRLYRAAYPIGFETSINSIGDAAAFIALWWMMLEMGIFYFGVTEKGDLSGSESVDCCIACVCRVL